MFIGSTVAGVPLLAGGGAAIWMQGSATTHAQGGGADPLQEHIVREVARMYTDAKTRGVRGEHVRTVASQLRTLAIYQRQTGANDEIRKQLAGVVAQHGRQEILSMPMDRERQAAELLKYGMEVNTSTFDLLPTASDETRNKLLDALLANGPAAAWEHVAEVLERNAAEVERRALGVQPITALQIDPSWCMMLVECKNIVELMVAGFCPFDAWLGAALEECIAAMAVLSFIALLIAVGACF
jgi:hypothetical protein